MKIKRYFAKDVKTALQMVREEQGPDAVIMSNNRVDGGVEIIAAIDYDETIFAQTPESTMPAKTSSITNNYEMLANNTATAERNQAHSDPHTDVDKKIDMKTYSGDEISSLKTELSSIKEMLEGQMASIAWSDLTVKKPVHAQFVTKLVGMGFSEGLSLEIISSLSEDIEKKEFWRQVLKELVNRIPVNNKTVLDTGGIVALVGPTGVGKTTTAAKLAATYALKHGKRKVGLITIDNYRVAAYEQLKVYGKIIDIPVKIAESNAELSSILNDFYDKELIIIDSSGLGQYDKNNTEQAAILDQSRFNVKKSLVIPANIQGMAAKDIIKSFACYSPADCIVTKLDESPMIGQILDSVIDADLPLAFTTNGQQVPEDISSASASKLITHCLALSKKEHQLPSDLEMAMNYREANVNACV